MQEIVTTYLDDLNIPVSKIYCEKLMLSHPDHPSLLSISDTLQRLGVDHQAARLSTDQLVDGFNELVPAAKEKMKAAEIEQKF